MAPEVLLKEPTTAASDVYAWAVTVNELATGVFPFSDCNKDNPQCQTILNFGYGRRATYGQHASTCVHNLLVYHVPYNYASKERARIVRLLCKACCQVLETLFQTQAEPLQSGLPHRLCGWRLVI